MAPSSLLYKVSLSQIILLRHIGLMNSLFRVCCKNFHAPGIPESWTWNYLCIFNLTYLSTVTCAEGSSSVREEGLWKGRLLGKGSLRPPKARNHSYRIALQRRNFDFQRWPTRQNTYFSTASLSWRQSIKGKRRLPEQQYLSIPWLDFGSPKLS